MHAHSARGLISELGLRRRHRWAFDGPGFRTVRAGRVGLVPTRGRMELHLVSRTVVIPIGIAVVIGVRALGRRHVEDDAVDVRVHGAQRLDRTTYLLAAGLVVSNDEQYAAGQAG